MSTYPARTASVCSHPVQARILELLFWSLLGLIEILAENAWAQPIGPDAPPQTWEPTVPTIAVAPTAPLPPTPTVEPNTTTVFIQPTLAELERERFDTDLWSVDDQVRYCFASHWPPVSTEKQTRCRTFRAVQLLLETNWRQALENNPCVGPVPNFRDPSWEYLWRNDDQPQTPESLELNQISLVIELILGNSARDPRLGYRQPECHL